MSAKAAFSVSAATTFAFFSVRSRIISGGALSGRMLHTVPGRLIVQAWRSTAFHKRDHDSTLILRFLPAGRNRCRIDLVHVNVPAHDYHGVDKGWKNYYWKPWRRVLARRARRE